MEGFELIRDLVGKANLKDAIKHLLNLNSTYKDAVIGLNARLNALEDNKNRGIINNDNANLEFNQITVALLGVISKMEEEAKKTNGEIEVLDKEGFEKIIGRNGLKGIDWLAKGIEKAKSVGKIHTSDGYVGTGFLVKGGFIFTNNHVISSASKAQFSKVEFGYDSPEVSSVFYELDHSTIVTSVSLDYTMIKVKDTDANVKLSHWGALEINLIPPNKEDALIIIQHPQGRSKELAFSDGGNSLWEHRLHYKVTTEPGSSGSPVFDINWKVVALHHAGGVMEINAAGDKKNVNEGILFKYIQEDLENQNQNQNNTQEEPAKNIEKTTKPIKAILVYNLEDKEYAESLRSHLYAQIRNGNLTIFDIQQNNSYGEDKEKTIDEELDKASMALILISKNLYKGDTLRIAEKIETLVSKKRVIPIRVSPFDLNGTPFQKLKGLPMGDKSISDFRNSDQVLFEIASAISNLIKSILST